MDIRESLRQFQAEQAEKRKAELEKNQQELKDYLESEQYQRDCWEHQQDLWEAKARKEGWIDRFKRQPFVSTLEKEQQKQQTKQEQIAFLKAKLQELEGE